MTPTAEAVRAAERIELSAISALPYLVSLKENFDIIRKHGKGLPPSAQRCEHLQSADLLISDLERMMVTLKTLHREEPDAPICKIEGRWTVTRLPGVDKSSLRATAPEFTFGDLLVNC